MYGLIGILQTRISPPRGGGNTFPRMKWTLSDRTSLLSLAGALEPRMAQLRSAFSAEDLPATERAIDRVRQAAEERIRTNVRTIGEI
jgi:hypothetical protein